MSVKNLLRCTALWIALWVVAFFIQDSFTTLSRIFVGVGTLIWVVTLIAATCGGLDEMTRDLRRPRRGK